LDKNLLLNRIALTLIPGIGPINSKNLLSYCGSAEAVFKSTKAKLLKIPGIGSKTIERLKQTDELLNTAKKEMDFITKQNIQAIFYTDPNYPQRLKQCVDAPLLLYQKGKADLNAGRMIAIVGTRRITSYGKQLHMGLIFRHTSRHASKTYVM